MLRQTKRVSMLLLLVGVCVFWAIDAVWGQSSSMAFESPEPQMIFLVDINPHQKNVLGVELALTKRILEKLRDSGNSFSIITFGSKPAALLIGNVSAEDAIAAVRNVALEQASVNYFEVYFYDALKFAMDEFGKDTHQKSIVVISEGDDYFPGKTFKDTLSRMQQKRIVCHAAMVASHSFYGTKGIQRYGFELRKLVGKTGGQYVEIGDNENKIPHAVDRITGNIKRDR